jgi:hypothetical protein
MPLTEGDVLDTLSDPVTLGIDFYADKIHVKGEYLTTVRDHIRAGNILVKGGTKDLAFYDATTDTMLTQKKSPPANDSDRALLLHECVHAMVDVYNPEGAGHASHGRTGSLSHSNDLWRSQGPVG